MRTGRTKWALLVALIAALATAIALGPGAALPPRPQPPTRDPNTPGYVAAQELPDGAVPPADAEGNFIIGPTHNAAGECAAGSLIEFTMSSADSRIYPSRATRERSGRSTPRIPPS